MLAFAGYAEINLFGGYDYTALVVMVESIWVVSGPVLLGVLGLGLAAFGVLRRKRK